MEFRKNSNRMAWMGEESQRLCVYRF